MTKTAKNAIKISIGAIFLAAAFVLCAVLPTYSLSNCAVAGDGTSQEIKTIEDFSKVMSGASAAYDTVSASVSDNENRSIASIDDFASMLADDATTGVTADAEVTSMSVRVTTDCVISGSSSYSYKNGSETQSADSSSHVSLTRELQFAFDGNTYYYNSVGNVYVSSSSTTNASSKVTYSFSVEFLQTEESVFMNVHKFTIIQDGISVEFPNEILNCWIEFSSDSDLQEIRSITLNWMDGFETMSQYTESYDSSNFIKTGSEYVMQDDYFHSFIFDLAGVSYTNNVSGKCEINLLTPKSPQLALYFSCNYSDTDHESNSGSSYSSSVKLNYYDDEKFVFENINNTVIQTDGIDEAISEEEATEILEETWGDLQWLN